MVAETEFIAIGGFGQEGLTLILAEVFGFPDHTSHWGGYDVRAVLELESDDFKVRSSFYTSTGELFALCQQMAVCNEQLRGEFRCSSCEGNLESKGSYDNSGHIRIEGRYWTWNGSKNQLDFEFSTDQTFIHKALDGMKVSLQKYIRV